jgi:hypothetical protein
MALLESTSRRTRAAAMVQDVRPPKRFGNAERPPQSRRENLREVGNTMLALMLVAIGIVILRYLLVVAHGLLH